MFESPFQAVDLHIFDVHTTIRPLILNNSLQERFRFLSEPEAYRTQYASGKSILTKSFDVHPLSKHSQTQNHVWKNYLNLFEDSSIDYWKLQAPFICSLRQPNIKLGEHLGWQGRIRPFIFLSALGWSSNLNIHLRGDIQISALLEFILGIIGEEGSTSTTSGLRLNGASAKLPQIFKDFKGRLLEEIYDPLNPPKKSPPELPRYLIVSLTKFTGTPLRYMGTTNTIGMTNADQALLHSLVRGEKIASRELGNKLRTVKYTMVDFGPGPDFMLTYFDHGTLVFMQNSARRNDIRQRRLSCVAANIRNYATLILSMYWFLLTSKKYANEAAVKGLRDSVVSNLSEMSNLYLPITNNTRGSVRWAKALFENHDGIKQLLPKST